MIIELIRKDIRLCRLPIVGMFCMLLVCLGFAWALVSSPAYKDLSFNAAVGVVLAVGTQFAGVVATGVLGVISGMIIATERAERSAEFLAYLPVSRRQVLSSKLIVVGGSILFAWVLPLVATLISHWIGGPSDAANELLASLGSPAKFAAVGVMFVGFGWCASAFFESTGPPVAISLLSPIVLASVLAGSQKLLGWPEQVAFNTVFPWLCVSLGILAFLTGTVYFLNRVEP